MLNIQPVIKPAAVPPEQLLVDVPTAAKLLAIGKRTLWRLSDSGEIPPIKIGRAVRYAVADLEGFIARRRGPAAVPANASVNETGENTEVIARQV